MSTMTPLIARDAPRYRVPPRSRVMGRRIIAQTAAPGSPDYARQFMTAFMGGLVFFSVLIF